MRLYDFGAFILIVALFGYLVFQADRTSVDGELKPDAIVHEIEEDYHDVEAEFAKGASANHGKYND